MTPLERAFAPWGPLSLAVLVLIGIVALVSAIAVVTRRNPVACVAWLVVHFVSTACTYILLDSQFLAAVQVLVYAGAIMVLFLFVIMLLSIDREPHLRSGAGVGRKALVVSLALVLVTLFARVVVQPGGPGPAPEALAPSVEDSVEWLATDLFSRHLVAFELSSLPLLAALAGVLVYTTRRALVRRKSDDAQ